MCMRVCMYDNVYDGYEILVQGFSFSSKRERTIIKEQYIAKGTWLAVVIVSNKEQ